MDRAGSSMRPVKQEPQGPGPKWGHGPPGTTNISHHFGPLNNTAKITVFTGAGSRLQASAVVSDVVEKNVDSSSKSNALRRRGKKYDALT